MIEYLIKHHKKSFKKRLETLIEEIKEIFIIENINVLNTENEYFKINFDQLSIDEGIVRTLNNLYYTISENHKEIPILSKYVDKIEINDSKYRFADLFAGCGGLSVGLESAGFKSQFVNEIDPTFAETYYFNHQLPLENYYVGDINELLKNDTIFEEKYLKELDLVCGGPPCQGFSMANRQRIIDDPRNNLYRAYLEFLSKTTPKFFIMENVRGMAKKVDEIISDFHKYTNNQYDISYKILNARDFGIPQNRERFFVIGNRIGIDSKEVFNQIEHSKQPTMTIRDAIFDLPTLGNKPKKNQSGTDSAVFGCTIRKYENLTTEYKKWINKNTCDYLINHKNRYNNERDIEIFRRLPQGANSLHESIKDIMPYSRRNDIFKDKYYKLNENNYCKTITSHMKFDCNMYIHPTQARGLSPREAARIQTFPDDYWFRGSQNDWYAQIGNAVPVKLAEIIGQSIIKFL